MADNNQKARHYDATEHKMSLKELKEKFQTDINEEHPRNSKGLSVAEAKARLAKYGPNAMKPPKRIPEICKWLLQFKDMFMLLLILAGVLSWILYGIDKTIPVNMYCGIALFAIVFLQCTASYLEERKSASVMDSLKQMMPAACNVIREGQPRRVPCADLVIGDVVQLKGGDRVPADCRIIQTSGLKVESSSLTGEPDAFEMTVNKTHEEPHESKNVCFNTAQCTEGAAFAVVFRTGDDTLIGQVAALAGSTGHSQSTLMREISRVVKFITALACSLALIVLIIGLARRQPTVIVINLVVTVFVANIPQGLPATVTSCLGIAAKRMFTRNVLVKNLQIIETLGSATCIASDKTGTLTQNKMSVQNFWFNGSYEMLRGGVMLGATSSAMSGSAATGVLGGRKRSMSDPLAEIETAFSRWQLNPLEPILVIAAVCNSAKFAAEEGAAGGPVPPPVDNKGLVRQHSEPNAPTELAFFDAIPEDLAIGAPRRETSRNGTVQTAHVTAAKASTAEIIGDASETALLRYCESIYPAERIRRLYRQLFVQPFNSTNKYALCVVQPPGNMLPGKQMIFLKGAPEIVLERCDTWLCGGVDKPKDAEFTRVFTEAYERFANAGERVLGFARLIVDERPADQLTAETVPNRGFCFMGLTSLMDPPKVGVDNAVEECRKAGIRTFMVTGDHALTAEAIAHQVNIITKPTRIDLAHLRGCPIAEVDPKDPEIKAVVITGAELRKLEEPDWQWLLDHDELVFARTTPQQKLEIVEHLQARKEVVAVTGDGVNDSPALKRANIGVAMGSPNASDVAREAADIIILDDDFCSIVNGIREGRLLFDNLKKSIAYTLTHLVPEMVPVFINIILSFPLGLSSMLILTIDLGSELCAAIALAYEEPENAIMLRPPRNLEVDRMVTLPLVLHSYVFAGFMQGAASILAYFCVFWSYGIDLKDLLFIDLSMYFNENTPHLEEKGQAPFRSGANTYNAAKQLEIFSIANAACYANIVLCQMFHVWFCRTRLTSVTQHKLYNNKLLVFAMPYELMFILIFCFIPGMQAVFASGQGLPIQFWFLSVGFLIFIAAWTETVKFYARKQLLENKRSFMAFFAW